MLRRRIRKTETAWRKLCRFLCFSAPIHWGTRVASAIRPVRAAVFFAEPQQGDSPSADGGNVAAPAAGAMPYPRRGAKRKDNLRFSFLFELLPFPCFLIWRRFPICDRFEKGNGSRVTAAYLSPPFRSVRYITATHAVYSTQARHDSAAQLFNTLYRTAPTN